ncbi:calcium/proton exchanger [Cryptococcus gattii E566]|uniref:Calcium ion transporter, putative n=2 Tax=Cryptococcus gattii TaxID=37769 RepID=E6QZQ5_CRYGW|nr:Calcium ion transporter, putative [Cryptococcus gattii WM276]ADV20121.1 Calcium ion transporter, putative [Cryptococcus gattii WM276]KIR77367.1 calcium/proton exchanger [Cryptococcus gattii EJB2]KIY36467.1 calcium/proton exchanger [Cryptococcus gattii E566]
MSLPRRVSFPPDALHEEPSLTDSPLSSPALPDYGPHSSSTPITSNGSPEGTTNSDSTGPRRRQQPSRQVTLDANPPSATRRQTTESARTQRSRAGSRRTSDSLDPNTGLVRRVTTVLFTPPKKIGKAPTYWGSLKAAITSTWLNVLLVFIPIGWALYLAKHNGGKDSISDTAVFCCTFIAIIPLAGLLGFATEEAALRLGQTLGGLLNATLGNAVELIVAILALIKCELQVVQSSLVGSILSNILLVLGMCFFAGGVRFAEQAIKSTAAQLNASLLLIAVIAVLIPSAFHFSISSSTSNTDASELANGEGADLLSMSHAVSILLLILYLGYLVFQMWTHATYYVDDAVTGSTQYPEAVTNVSEKLKFRNFHRKKHDEEEGYSTATTVSDGTVPPSARAEGGEVPATHGPGTAAAETGNRVEHEGEEEEEEEETPQMNVVCTIALMVIDTVLVGVTAEFLVDSINGMVASNPSLSAEWVGLILLPIVGNAAEHFTAVSVSVKDKLDLSISVAVGSSIQIALFVIPVIELLAWTIGKPMTLLFDPYESIVLFLSVLIVNQTLADGRSNWMEGMVLMMLYIIIAVSFWYYPGSSTATLLGCKDSSSVTG